MSFNTDDLQLLIDIVACGSFSQAAARRAWSQPQVSARVAILEADLGVKLFVRHRRGAVPTTACQAFLPAAQEALAALDKGRSTLLSAPALPKMALATLPSLASVIFGPLLVALHKAAMEIHCSCDHSPNIMEQLLCGKVDLGFVLKCPPMAGIQMERVWHSPIIPVVHKHHHLANAGSLSLAQISNEKLSPLNWGEACMDLIRQIRAQRTVTGTIHLISPASAARELVMEHGFLSFIPEMAVKRDLRAGRMVKLEISDLPLWEWDVMMVWRSGKRHDANKQLVIDTARAMATDWIKD